MYIGNKSIRQQIEVALESARKRNSALPHMLFSGAPGCGKTTLAKLMAKTGGMDFMQVVPEEFNSYKNIIKILDNMNLEGYNRRGDKVGQIKPTILFIDEIHNISMVGQEKLGIVMEDFKLESNRKRNSHIWFPLFTIIGATTQEGILSKPYRDRFKLTFHFETYNMEDMAEIVNYHAKKRGLMITPKACRKIASRSKGTPRIAVRLVERVQDYIITNSTDVITSKVALAVFDLMNLDEKGLNLQERKILLALYNTTAPIGLDSLAISANVSKRTITDSLEPFLIQEGLITRSGRGRILTPEGIEYVEKSQSEESGEIRKEEITTNYQRKL